MIRGEPVHNYELSVRRTDTAQEWIISYSGSIVRGEGEKPWTAYRDKIFSKILSEAGTDGSWNQGYIGPVYTTAINLTILQLENGTLPIYQR